MEQRRGPHLLRLLRGDAATGPPPRPRPRPRPASRTMPRAAGVHSCGVRGHGAGCTRLGHLEILLFTQKRLRAAAAPDPADAPPASPLLLLGPQCLGRLAPPHISSRTPRCKGREILPDALNFPAETQTLFGVLSRPYNPLRAARTGPAAQVCLLRRLPGGAGDRCLAPSAPTCRVQVRPAGPPCRDQAGLASSAPQPSARCGPRPPPRLCLCSDPRGPLEDGGGRPTRTPHKTRSVS